MCYSTVSNIADVRISQELPVKRPQLRARPEEKQPWFFEVQECDALKRIPTNRG